MTHESGADPRATFPNARYVAHRADWEVFQRPEVMELFPPHWDQALGPLQDLGVLDLLEGESPLTGEITAIHTPGHTPGSMSLAIVSGGQRAYILGDVFHGPAQITETDMEVQLRHGRRSGRCHPHCHDRARRVRGRHHGHLPPRRLRSRRPSRGPPLLAAHLLAPRSPNPLPLEGEG